MEFNILKNIVNDVKKVDISSFIQELTERLEIMEKELTIDRFEDKFAICEDRKTKKTYNVEKSKLPENVKEGSIIKFKNGKYEKCQIEEEISKRIGNKMEDLWN